ncbi:helix-turn-helix transcriptional regulator [Brevibacillus antibioticus]|uniref:Helix-turn-helix transcriptional regulator n=2 Tax=Brevibacillus antibioticus TaxID=2570228 RepID=A0A4U2YBE9_9BACL|nr:helix-turn-helix transcriptional regulator [Brevibacillus antibioticus]
MLEWNCQNDKGGLTMSIIGQRIKWLREQKQWSQLQLAEKLGIHNTVLSRIESGEKKGVDFHLISKVADLFEVSTDFLHGRTEELSWQRGSVRETPATFLDVDGLSEDELIEVKRHIEFLKWKALQEKNEDPS